LGALPPGEYGFWVTYVDLWPDTGPGPPGTGSWTTFTSGSVPVSDDRTLSGWVDTNSATFQLAVEGVSNVTYVIETSSDFTNWTTLTTKTNAPFVWSEPLQTQTTSRFYRTQIIGN